MGTEYGGCNERIGSVEETWQTMMRGSDLEERIAHS